MKLNLIPKTTKMENVTLKDIKEYIEQFQQINDIAIKQRTEDLIFARGVFYYVAHQLGFSKNRIGKFVNRDHCAVINSSKTFEGLLFKNVNYKDDFNDVCVHFGVANDVQIKQIVSKRQKRIIQKMLNESMQKYNPMIKEGLADRMDLIDLIAAIPSKHVETVKTRLTPIVNMLPA
jgi:hypothetical protein